MAKSKIDNYPELRAAVSNAFVDILQRFPEETRKKVLSVLSFSHVPKGIVDKDFFEKEFFPLETEKDFEKLTKILQDAKMSLEKGRYYFEERPDKFPDLTNKLFKRGVASFEDILKLFSHVLPKTNDNILKIVDTEIKGKSSNKGNKEAICRILKRALVTYSLDEHFDILPQASEVVMDNMFPSISTDILEKEREARSNAESIYTMQSVKDEVKGQFIFGEGKEAFYNDYISRLMFNFKHKGKAVDKVERKKKVKGADINDLFRLKILFDDKRLGANDCKVEEIIKFMGKQENLAKKSAKAMADKLGYKKLEVVVESREINYLSEEEKKKYFPNKIEGKGDHFCGEELGYVYLPPKKKEDDKKSADSYQDMSQKVSYIDPETGKYVFSFEIKYATEEENKKNENERQAGGHFMMELRNNAELIFAMGGGKRKKEAIIKSIKRYLEWYRDMFIETGEIDKFPDKLYGEFSETPGWKSTKGSGKFRMGGYEGEVKEIYFDKFRNSNVEEKAEAIFNFLWAEGKIKKVPIDFPKDIYEGRVSQSRTLEASPYFCSSVFINDINKTKKKKDNKKKK